MAQYNILEWLERARKMGKFYVCIELSKRKYKVNKQDIREVFSLRRARMTAPPAYAYLPERDNRQNFDCPSPES